MHRSHRAVSTSCLFLFACLLLNGIANAKPWISEMESPQYLAVDVRDVDAAIEWYTKAFGVRIIDDSRAEDGRWRIANLRNDFLMLELIWDRRTVESAPEARHHGFAKVGFFVPDVNQVADNVRETTGERPRVLDFEEHGVRLIQLRDPEDNLIQIQSKLESTD